MFKGFDRAKYDLKDPSAWHAIKRDRALHEQALKTIARHLNIKPARMGGNQVPQINLPPAQQAELNTRVPVAMQSFAQEVLRAPPGITSDDIRLPRSIEKKF